jgi:Zn-dependent protease
LNRGSPWARARRRAHSSPSLTGAGTFRSPVLGLLGSLLVHELAHAVATVRNGVGVHSITLWMLGGRRLDGEPPDAGTDTRIRQEAHF